MTMSTIIIELPQEIEQQLEEAWGNGHLARHILEAVAVEG